MSKINFTDAKLRNLQPKNKRYSVMDTKEDGLELLVYPKGTKTFCLYKRIKGMPNHKKLGNFGDINVAQAREIANTIKNRMYENPYLNTNDRLARLTLNDVFELYMVSKINLAERTFDEYKRLWSKNIKDTVGNLRVLTISVETLEEFRNNLAETPYQANRCIGLIKAVFNYLINRKSYTIPNPAKGIEKFNEAPCIRALDSEEIGAVISAVNHLLNKKFSLSYYAILCLLLIPVRKSALLQMRWQDIKLAKKIWIVPKTKNKTNLVVNLPDAVIPLLVNLKRIADIESDYVFYSKNSKTGHLVDVKKSWNIVKIYAGLKGRVRLHDFRHTYATFMAQLTGNAYKIKVALGHNSLKSSEIYVNLVKEQVRDSVNETVGVMLEKVPLKEFEKGKRSPVDAKDMIIQASIPREKIEIPSTSYDETKKIIQKLWQMKMEGKQ